MIKHALSSELDSTIHAEFQPHKLGEKNSIYKEMNFKFPVITFSALASSSRNIYNLSNNLDKKC